MQANKQRKLWYALVFAFGFLLYANTLSFEYALDDKMVITQNQITKRGWEGVFMHFKHDAMDGFWADQYGKQVEELNMKSMVSGGRYRPLTLATHAVEWALFGKNPLISHGVNAILYGLLGVILLALLLQLFPQQNIQIWSVPVLVSLLYLAHPLHTEVVANIKGRDELLSVLFGLLAMYLFFKAAVLQNQKWVALAALFFLAGLFSKETVAGFAVLIPLSVWFFRKEVGLKWLGYNSAALFVALGVYLFIRSQVLDTSFTEPPRELMNNPFAEAVGLDKWASILVTFAAYVKLSLIPYPLTHDYYPFHLPFVEAATKYPAISHPAALFGLLSIIALLGLALWGLLKRNILGFAALLFWGSFILVSNVLFPVGVFMNERFMFAPSLGILLLGVPLIHKGLQNYKVGTQAALALVILAFSALTIQRNYAWQNDDSLALADVQTSIGSAKAHMGAGDAYLRKLKNEQNQQKKQEYTMAAFGHLKKSLEIYPGYFPPLDLLGILYFENGNYSESLRFFALCADRKPNDAKFVNNMHAIGNKLVQEERYEEAERAYIQAIQYNPFKSEWHESLGELYGKHMNQPQKALESLKKAHEINPNSLTIVEKMGVSNAMMGNFDEAIRYFEQALSMDPNNGSVLHNLGVSYLNMGRQAEGMELMERAKKLQAK